MCVGCPVLQQKAIASVMGEGAPRTELGTPIPRSERIHAGENLHSELAVSGLGHQVPESRVLLARGHIE